jgi:hypothetical protein
VTNGMSGGDRGGDGGTKRAGAGSMSEMKIRSVAPWFGGKRTMADTIIAEAGEHRSWWEPFCGGVSIILQKPRCRQEALNDLHGDLTNLSMVLASERCPELYAKAWRTLYCEGLYNACRDAIAVRASRSRSRPRSVDPAHVERAYRYLVLSWMGRNGAAGTAPHQLPVHDALHEQRRRLRDPVDPSRRQHPRVARPAARRGHQPAGRHRAAEQD